MSANNHGLGPDPTSQALLRLIPGVGEVAATWRQETFERQQRRVEKLGAAAAEELGAEQFFAQIASDERLTDMFNAAVDSAVATSSDAKIRLLGRALASGASAADHARVDESEQLLRIALDLEPIDLRALRSLEAWKCTDPVSTVAYALDVSHAIAGPIVGRLERLRLIQVERTAAIVDKGHPDDDQVQIDEEWTLTDTAIALFDLLADRVSNEAPEPVASAGTRWEGFTATQADLLEALVNIPPYEWRSDAWTRQSISRTLGELEIAGLSHIDIRNAMRAKGFGKDLLAHLDRWAGTR